MEESDKNKRNKKKKSEMKQKKKTQNNVNVQRLVTEKERKKLAKKNVQGHFGQLMLVNFSSKFSPHFGKKIFWWAWEKNTWVQPHFFPLSLPTKHTLKLLSLHFSLLNFPSSLKSLQTNTP